MSHVFTCLLKILLVFPPIKILMKRKYEASSRLCANFHLDKKSTFAILFLFFKRQFLKQLLRDKLGKLKTVPLVRFFSLFCFCMLFFLQYEWINNLLLEPPGFLFP